MGKLLVSGRGHNTAHADRSRVGYVTNGGCRV